MGVGFERDTLEMTGTTYEDTTYEEMVPGAWQVPARLAAMDRNHTEPRSTESLR